MNHILPNIIQKGCDSSQVPYLTAGTFTERQYIYRDDELFIEEVMVQGDCFRNMIFKDSPSFVQAEFKLTYFS